MNEQIVKYTTVILFILTTLTSCTETFVGIQQPKFHNFQTVQTVEGKVKVQIVGTKCDQLSRDLSTGRCRYQVKLPFVADCLPMVQEVDLEEITENK